MAKKIKKSVPWIVFLVLAGLIVGAGFISFWSPKLPGARAATSTKITPSVTVGNATPTVAAVDLTLPAALTDNSTTTATCTAEIQDPNGGDTISSATATVYRSGVTSTYACVNNDNNCYQNITLFATSSSGNSYYATWTVALWFHAEPTDDGGYSEAQGWDTETWQCYVIAGDSGGLTATGTESTSTAPDMNSVAALTITSSIDYGELQEGATSSESSITTATTTGNVPINVSLSGVDMTSGTTASTIPVENQEYATSAVAHGSGTNLTASSTPLELDSLKPVKHDPTVQATATDNIYWRIEIPSGQYPADYSGTSTVAASEDATP